MEAIILLNYNEKTHNVEEEERQRFLRTLLEQMGVPVEDFWTTDGPLSVEQRIRLRGILTTYSIRVIDSLDGELQVYVDGEKIATWNKPTYKLKKDLREIDPRKQLYLEMHVDCESVFEEFEEKEND